MPAQLYTERIARSDQEPSSWLLLTHGIYGAGSNWRGIARKLNAQRPEWGVVLVDLRQHGRSDRGDPPHTLAAAAGDVRVVIEAHGIRAIAGHSFGGKVVLKARELARVEQTWLLDASPSARPDAMTDRENSVLRVLEFLERAPAQWPKREDFVAAVMAEGHAQALAQWLAMNIVDGELRLDPAALRELLASYYATDLWDSLFDPARGAVEIAIAERSRALDVQDRSRLAGAPPHVTTHHVDADHWLHIEAPDAVVALFVARLPR